VKYAFTDQAYMSRIPKRVQMAFQEITDSVRVNEFHYTSN